MTLRLRTVLLALCWALAAASPASAQALPDVVRRSPHTQAEWAAQLDDNQSLRGQLLQMAHRAGVAESVVRNIAIDVFGAQPGQSTATYLSLVEQGLQHLPETVAQARALDPLDDPSLQAIKTRALAAAEAGRLAEASNLLGQFADAYDRLAQSAANRIARERAANYAAAGAAAFAAADFVAAAERYAAAARRAPDDDPHMRWSYVLAQADATYARGANVGDAAALSEAIRLYQEVVLPAAPRDARPLDWAVTSNNLGLAQQSAGAYADAAASYQDALSIYRRDQNPVQWAAVEGNLANVLARLGEQGRDANQLAQAAAHMRAALEVSDRARVPLDWAALQNNLGVALVMQGEISGDMQVFGQGLAAYNAAEEVRTPQSDPRGWADTEINIANALLWRDGDDNEATLRLAASRYRGAAEMLARSRDIDPQHWRHAEVSVIDMLDKLGDRGDAQARSQAIEGYRAIIATLSRDDAPDQWAHYQFNLGVDLANAGFAGDFSAFAAAADAYRAALPVYTPGSRWRAPTEKSLAVVLHELIAHGDRSLLPEAISAARDARDDYARLGDAAGVASAERVIEALTTP